MTKPVVLLLGATGLFGGLLAQRLIKQGRFDVVCAGRNEATLEAFCTEHGGKTCVLDREDDAAVRSALDLDRPVGVGEGGGGGRGGGGGGPGR